MSGVADLKAEAGEGGVAVEDGDAVKVKVEAEVIPGGLVAKIGADVKIREIWAAGNTSRYC